MQQDRLWPTKSGPLEDVEEHKARRPEPRRSDADEKLKGCGCGPMRQRERLGEVFPEVGSWPGIVVPLHTPSPGW